MKTEEINIRDPFVYVEDGVYYLYGTRAKTCWGPADGFDVYWGTDLENWEGPHEIFHNDGSFWADRNYWAPELHKYRGKYYIFASFKNETECRGTQILISDNPKGPFVPHSDGPVTPRDWECLDGTFYVSKDGTPYMVFCHEWVQIVDGTICAIPLTEDLKAAAGEPRVLFHASEAVGWTKGRENYRFPGKATYVTDGPFLHRCENGELLLLWSGFGEDGYAEAIARSDNGDITGNWTQDETPLFEKDGGHGMIFRTPDGQLYLTLHSPNKTPEERPKFYPLIERGGQLGRLP